MCLCQEGIRLPTLALKPRGDLCHQKSKNRGTSGPLKEHMSTKYFIKTRLHCSGMPTICCSGCPGEGGCLPWWCLPRGGVCLWGCLSREGVFPEGCLPGDICLGMGVCPEGCLPAQGGDCLPKGCLPDGCLPRGRTPREQNDRQV